jgi:hypothetical protein
VPIGSLVGINVTVQDLGGFDENFNVTIEANSQVIGVQSVLLTTGSSANLVFTLNTASFTKGDYNISASVSLAPGEVNTGNETGIASTPVTILTPGHDIAVVGLIPLKTVVGQGYNMNIAIFVKDYGMFSETFNVTAYANATLVGTKMVALASAEEAELLFNSSTLNITKGKYNVSASAGPVSGEMDTSDNSRVDGLVIITIPGDVNGDGSVNIYDAIILSSAFKSSPGFPNWSSNADINGDNNVDIYDAILLSGNFGKQNL